MRTIVLVAIALAGLAVLYRDTEGGLLKASVWTVPFILLALLVSWPWRTVSPATVALSFLMGFGPLFGLSVLLQLALEAASLGDSVAPLFNDPRLQLWAPLTEELVKLVPVILLIQWRPAGLRGRFGPLDLALIAGATGAGLGFAEDILRVDQIDWNVPTSPLFGLGVGRVYLSVVGVEVSPYPSDGVGQFASLVSNVLPTVEPLSSGVVWPGHAALPAGIGLAVGLTLMAVTRARFVVGLAVGAASLVYAVMVHITANWYADGRCVVGDFSPPCIAASADLMGRVSTLLIVIAWIVAAVLSHRVMRWHRAVDGELYPPLRQIAWRPYLSAGAIGALAFARDLLTFVRLRHCVAFGARRFRQSNERDRLQAGLPTLATRTRALLLMTRLFGRSAPEVPQEIRRIIEILAPLT